MASPAEFASPTGVEGLRRRLMQAAGLDPLAMPPGDRLIYLARRGETRRPMVEAETVIDLAESLGMAESSVKRMLARGDMSLPRA